MRIERILSGLLLIVVATTAVNLAWAAKPGPKPGIASWTFIVYMVADNNLDSWAYTSLSYMEAVGSTEQVNIVVLWDGYYAPAYMYRVVKGGHELVSDFPLNGQEVNMGDSNTLGTLVDFVTNRFTANHYLLDLWDHGDDFTGSCWDSHPVDYLTHAEVVMALSGHHIDILAYDACLEAMIEVAYEYNAKGLMTDYLVACENYVPMYGYPYDKILENLTARPDMLELDFAKVIVTEYAKFYMPRAHFNGGVMATLSVIDISMVDEAVQELAALTDVLKNNMAAYHDLISDARGEGNLPWSEYGWDLYIDLPTFVKYLNSHGDETVSPLAGTLLATLQNDVIKAVANTEPMNSAGALGIGIWFPPSYATQWTKIGLRQYTKLQFASQGWLDFLYTYWHGGCKGRR